MKKWRTSAIALLLMMCMIFTTACGSKADKEDQDVSGKNPQVTQGGSSSTTTPEPDATTPTPDAATPTPEGPKDIVTIKWGTHAINEIDPYKKDELGEYRMEPGERAARLAAEEAVLNELGVKFEYVDYVVNTTEALLQSVLAGDPICDIAVLWGGSEATVLSQNVLQPIDDYVHIFQDNPDYSWMLYDQLYGHYYMLTSGVYFVPRWPLCYNIDYIEAVDSLKDDNGNTIYPNTLFEKGEWTWSTFKDYLSKITAYYASNNPDLHIYWTDHRFAALSAIYSAGGAIYDNGVAANSPATKKGVAYIKELLDAKLLTEKLYDDGFTPEWMTFGNDFAGGKSVFTDMPDWNIAWAGDWRGGDGQGVGIVPWPRPDDMAFDSEDYNQVISVENSIGILKGTSPEKTELALKALALFYKVYYQEKAANEGFTVSSMAEYMDALGYKQAGSSFKLDVMNEEIGDEIWESFQYIMTHLKKDYASLLGIRDTWDAILGKALYGVDGFAAYDVAIEANLNDFADKEQEMIAILSSTGVHDNVKPSASFKKQPVVVPAGTKMTDEIWGEFLGAKDNVDGELTLASFKPEFNDPVKDKAAAKEYSEADLEVPGYYHRMFRGYFEDSSGNRDYKTVSVYVYDPNNTEAPTITLEENPPVIALNTDTSTIAWASQWEYNSETKTWEKKSVGFVETAVDADGVDVLANVKADLSELDTSTPGTYSVKITVTDWAGNTAEATASVVVE